MKNAKISRLGFTLIELLVVVLIIGILASVALPQYQKAVEKSRVAEAWSILKTLNDALAVKKMETDDTNQYTKDALDVEVQNSKYFEYAIFGGGIPQAMYTAGTPGRWDAVLVIIDGQKRCHDVYDSGYCQKIGLTKIGTSCLTGGGDFYNESCYVE